MRLFHFTAAHHVEGGGGHAGPGIRHEGINPNIHPLIHIPAHVWLTEDGSWEQVWSPRPVPLPDGTTCDRTEVRLTVDVPLVSASLAGGLWRYAAIRGSIDHRWLADFEGGHDLSAWWVHFGFIAPQYVVGIDPRPARLGLPEAAS